MYFNLLLPFLYSLTLFISAVLLFWVQPMFGKIILPMLGSSPNVWLTCMVFFQAMLLAGYTYAHLSTSFLGVKKQALIHLFLLFLPLLFLPIAIPVNSFPPTNRNPVFWQLMLMIRTIGLPFFMISVNAPMLQKWFSNTAHSESKDPYFLYVGSNLGSMLALIGYPFLLEPNFKLLEQSFFWMWGYFLIVFLTMVCAVMLWCSNSKLQDQRISESIVDISVGQKILWILLSFVPSSLMLGLTTFLSTDIAAVPLLWVIPLAIYLLTFVLVFARKPLFNHELLVKTMPILVIPMTVQLISGQMKIITLSIFIHILTFFIASMICHGELARKRPPASHLTEFYLWISVGGFLGGVFNAIVAPLVFKSVAEYQIALVLAYLLRPKLTEKKDTKKDIFLDILIPVFVCGVCASLAIYLKSIDIESKWFNDSLFFVLAAMLSMVFAFRPIRFALTFGAILLACVFYSNAFDKTLSIKRSFFGVHKVVIDKGVQFKYLIHGRTIHGAQKLSDLNQCNPLTYYYPTGPIGQLLTNYNCLGNNANVAVIGLGAGSLACYGKSGDNWTFYEIDPVVEYFATNEKYFTFLKNSKARCNIILGDGRLTIKSAHQHSYDLIVLDAFSSDSIPMHLLTKEALNLYLSKLKENGVLAFHISSQYLDLRPVLAGLANDSGITSYVEKELKINKEEMERKKEPSMWVVMSRDKKNLGKLIEDKRWGILLPKPDFKIWTDDFSNILSVFMWKK